MPSCNVRDLFFLLFLDEAPERGCLLRRPSSGPRCQGQCVVELSHAIGGAFRVTSQNNPVLSQTRSSRFQTDCSSLQAIDIRAQGGIL
jgi:hypothetical protein